MKNSYNSYASLPSSSSSPFPQPLPPLAIYEWAREGVVHVVCVFLVHWHTPYGCDFENLKNNFSMQTNRTCVNHVQHG